MRPPPPPPTHQTPGPVQRFRHNHRCHSTERLAGNDKLGAAIGVYMENRLTLDMDVYSGSFEVVVDDKAYAEAKLGLIGVTLDIFRAEACYKGGVGLVFAAKVTCSRGVQFAAVCRLSRSLYT